MPSNCNRKNPLVRSGANQGQRRLPALDPAFFRVDERDTADLILFAGRFSRHLNYYAADNTLDGDWLPFFSTDIAAILAALSELPVEAFQSFARSVQAYLIDDQNRPDADLSAHFKLLFHLPLLLLVEAGDAVARLPREHSLHDFLQKLIARDVAEPLGTLLAYYKGALGLAAPLFDDTPLAAADYNTIFDDSDPRIQLPTAVRQRFSGAALSGLPMGAEVLAALGVTDWTTYYNTSVVADSSPYDPSTNFYVQIYDALTFNLLDKALERLFQAMQRIVLEAAANLQASLTSFAEHTPHYALWLAFLRLFRFSQEHLNTLTGRHLEYYYREVLQLCRQAAQPNQVHLLFELNKNVAERLLPAAGTLFRAGKDAAGKEVLYRLDSDLVVNRARVAALKSLFFAQPSLPRASAVANSSDGLGQALPKDKPQWRPFGPPTAPPARIGFAVADRQLFLREGNRSIMLNIESEQVVPKFLFALAAGFRAALTSEKGWFDVPGTMPVDVQEIDDFNLKLVISLSAEDPPIVAYDPAIHGEGYNVTEPMLKIEFAFESGAAVMLFQELRDLQFKTLDLQVEVDDLRNVTLQNENGVIDSSKPFLPFGPMPAKDSPLILGSSELFSKPLDEITLHVEWAEALGSGGVLTSTIMQMASPGMGMIGASDNLANISVSFGNAFYNSPSSTSHTARMRHLKAGKWEPLDTQYNVALFPSSGTSKDIPLTGLAVLSVAAAQTPENEPFSPTSQAGFIKLELSQGFGHLEYLDAKTQALITLARDGTGDLPDPPYTPKINDFSLSYTTVGGTPAHFFHLQPFGFTKPSIGNSRVFAELPNQGELYIGVADLAPPQRLTLLFQVADGTANPLKQAAALQWEYLQGDAWIPLDAQAIDDRTNNLTGSGIVGIAVPTEADTQHNLIPAGQHWFRLAAAQDSDALNDLLSIDAQAASATFMDQGNDPQFLAAPLPPGVIAKLKTSDAAIKKITQPYAAFGGKPAESAPDFSVRVSERLRHKDRAVTMWDYEHLILQEFPRIYKVRCINHTELVRDAANTILADNEVRPGHVLVVTIPYVDIASARDPLRPYTDKRTLGEIDSFLRRRISPFVQLEVQNPKFEEVRVKFKVAFTAQIADTDFYIDQLNAAIVRYLSPWSYDEGAEISFGGKWHKSAIINFVEEQPYVDYLQDFEMYHKANIDLLDAQWTLIDEEVIEATSARSILVSRTDHIITEI
jgi:hypothetical protein